jgi:hypothetical protein
VINLEHTNHSELEERSCRDSTLREAILCLPAVQAEIAERANILYLMALSPPGRAREYWLAAEEEALAWIDVALACTSLSLPGGAVASL